MMYAYGQMMGWNGGIVGTLGFLTWLVWLLVGVLLAVFLWQKISKN